MGLVRMLYFCAVKFDVSVMIRHIVGSNDEIADGLSDFQAICFYQLVPVAELQLDIILV